FMHNPMPMWIVDTRTLRFRDVNQAAINHYGYGKREFLKMTVDDLQLDGSPLQSQYKKIGRTGAYSAGVTEHKKKDGSVIFVEITVDDLALGNSHESLVIAQDVTEKRRAMQQLEQQNNELLKIN